MAGYDPILDTHRNMVVDELREDVLVYLQLHSLVIHPCPPPLLPSSLKPATARACLLEV